MLITGNALLILAFLILMQTLSCAKHNRDSACRPSSCGNIGEIRYPFRLEGDPPGCGDPRYEISCDKNSTASVFVESIKYVVRDINYQNRTVRVSDPAVKDGDYCTFPVSSPRWSNLLELSSDSVYVTSLSKINESLWPITFLSCPFPQNDSRFIQTDRCSSSDSLRHTYVLAGVWDLKYLHDMCRIDSVAMTSMPSAFKSLSQVHDSLIHGFELSWSPVYCKCQPEEDCYFNGTSAYCIFSSCTDTYYMLGVLSWKIFGPRLLHGSVCSTSTRSLFLNALTVMLIALACFAVMHLVLRIIIGMPFLLGLIIYKFRRRHLSVFDIIEGFLRSQTDLKPIRYSYAEIKKMTRGFQERLGHGGFASVYKGKLRSGIVVAVKVLSKSCGDGQDFINEVSTLGRIHHVNIVKLIGFCVERSKRALVYEFMPNGSLEKYIYNQEKGQASLNWNRKYEIALGVARGIEYLHRGCDIQILHFDIKPHNILLDEKFTPKVSDFGISKFYSADKITVTITAPRGTIGYVAPEIIHRSIGGISYKADVYSFGMVLMDIVSLKKHVAECDHDSSCYFPDFVYDILDRGEDSELGHADENGDDCKTIIRRMTIVALWCIQMSPSDRPSMKEVVRMLETEDKTLEIPPRPWPSLPSEQGTQSNSNQNWISDSVALLVTDTSPDHSI